MNNRRIKNKVLTPLALISLLFAGSSLAAELMVDTSIIDRAQEVLRNKQTEIVAIQREINRLANAIRLGFN